MKCLAGGFKNIPLKELGDLVTAGCLSIGILSTGALGTGGVLSSSSSLCFLALLGISSVGCTSSCGGVVGSYLSSELETDSF